MRIFDGGTVVTSFEGVHAYKTNAYGKFDDRPFHGFIFKTAGESQYFFNNKTLVLEENQLLYIPKHSHHVIHAGNGGSYMVINFQLLAPANVVEPTKIIFNDHSKVQRLFHQIQNLWVLKNDSDILMAKALLYQIIAEVSRQQEASYISPVAKEKISAAIDYLRQHLYDVDLRVRDLYTLLHMSNTHFRQLFKQVYFMTPIQYINQERMEQAKALLISSDFDTIEQVAHAVGFSDVFYFSNVFKVRTGKTPSAWKQDASNQKSFQRGLLPG